MDRTGDKDKSDFHQIHRLHRRGGDCLDDTDVVAGLSLRLLE